MIELFNLKGVSYSHYVECYNFSPLFFKSPRLMSSYHAYRVTSGFTGKHTHSQVHSQIHSTHTHTQTFGQTTIYIMPSARVQFTGSLSSLMTRSNRIERGWGGSRTTLMSGHIARGSETSRQRTSEKVSLSPQAHFWPLISSKKPIHNYFCYDASSLNRRHLGQIWWIQPQCLRHCKLSSQIDFHICHKVL